MYTLAWKTPDGSDADNATKRQRVDHLLQQDRFHWLSPFTQRPEGTFGNSAFGQFFFRHFFDSSKKPGVYSQDFFSLLLRGNVLVSAALCLHHALVNYAGVSNSKFGGTFTIGEYLFVIINPG
jgi:hypothetical protein